MGENIGATARAMLNFGLTDLRIVNPRDGWPNDKAIDMAAGALEQMPSVQIFDTLKRAIADCTHTYATTARPRDMVKLILTPRTAAQDATHRIHNKKTIGFVFGGERAGLTNDEIAHCTNIIQIPTNPNFSSLNLGQAVLLIAYEIFQAQDETPKHILNTGDSHPAPQAELENLLNRLETALTEKNFFKSASLKPTMIRNLRNIFTRTELTQQEINTLQGVITALKSSNPKK